MLETYSKKLFKQPFLVNKKQIGIKYYIELKASV